MQEIEIIYSLNIEAYLADLKDVLFVKKCYSYIENVKQYVTDIKIQIGHEL